MARKKKPQRGPLYKIVENALKHYDDVNWLGSESWLSSPYLIGPLLQEGEDVLDPQIRGRKLQTLLRKSVEASDPYHSEILQQTFLSGRKHVKGVWDELVMSEATYHRERTQAIIALEKRVVDYLQPALRLESPMDVTQLIDRKEDLAHSLATLHQAQSVALTGPGGIGKTTLGSYLAHRFTVRPKFWFTFYLGLNDQPDAVLFSLGYFLHQQGVSALWSQVLVHYETEKSLDLNLAQNLLRHDLAELQPHPPCSVLMESICCGSIRMRPTLNFVHFWRVYAV